MKTTCFNKPLGTLVTQALLVTVPEGKDKQLPREIVDLIPNAAHQSFTGKLDQVLTVFPATGSIDRIVLVGLGDGSGSRSAVELFRRAMALGIKQLTARDCPDIAIYLGGLFESSYITDAVLMALLATYHYSAHRSTKENEPVGFSSLTLVALNAKLSGAVDRALHEAAVIGSAVNQARDLVNRPSNLLTPILLASVASELADCEPTLTATAWSEAELRKRKFGALLAVSRGSSEEAQLITLEYRPKVESRKSKVGTVALVGKGITFDSGGINLKPSQHIADMHMDMAGGAVVLATLQAIAELAIPIHVIGIVPATENMPGGAALKPGDVVTSKAGLTIEVADTDAEGRLVLADGLAHATSFKPDYILDLATLTGAAVVALGEERAAVIGNDQPLLDHINAAGEATGELVWQLPLDDDYRSHVKSEVADVKNIGKRRSADTIAGAAFLEKFVPKDTPWAHIDLAGPAMRSESGPYWPKGGTGWGVQLLIELLRHLSR